MSMRSFLDIRYTLPGYTFLLFVFVINVPKLPPYLENMGDPFISIFIGIITVVSGAPLGFLISQIWYLFLTQNWFGIGIYGKQGNKKKYIDYLHKKGVIEDKTITVNVLDYLYHQCDNKDLKDYVNRRWNMYNIFGSTSFAVIIGTIFGLLFRNHLEPITISNILLHEKVMVVLGIFLIGCFYFGMKPVRDEHEYMVWIIIRNVVRKDRYWKEKFPNSFFNRQS